MSPATPSRAYVVALALAASAACSSPRNQGGLGMPVLPPAGPPITPATPPALADGSVTTNPFPMVPTVPTMPTGDADAGTAAGTPTPPTGVPGPGGACMAPQLTCTGEGRCEAAHNDFETGTDGWFSATGFATSPVSAELRVSDFMARVGKQSLAVPLVVTPYKGEFKLTRFLCGHGLGAVKPPDTIDAKGKTLVAWLNFATQSGELSLSTSCNLGAWGGTEALRPIGLNTTPLQFRANMWTEMRVPLTQPEAAAISELEIRCIVRPVKEHWVGWLYVDAISIE